MHRLILVFAGCTDHCVGLSCFCTVLFLQQTQWLKLANKVLELYWIIFSMWKPRIRLEFFSNRQKSDFFIWTASSEFGTYRLWEQRRFRRACASVQSRQNLRCLLIQTVSQEEPSDRKPDPWPLWMAGHAQLKFVMTECSKTQNRLTGPICV